MSTLLPWIFFAALVVTGLIAAAKKIGELIPASKGLTDSLQGASVWIGLVAIFLSLWWIIRLLMWIKYINFFWLVALICALVMLALGLLLAKGQLEDWTKSQAAINNPLKKIWAMLEPKQEILGLSALILALVYLGRIL